MRSRGSALLALGIGFAVGCGTTVNNNVEGPVIFSIGGQVLYDASYPVQPLSGVLVKVAAPGGAITTATTDSAGLWNMSGFAPGVYTATFALAGYQTIVTDVNLSAFGANNVSNPYVAVGSNGVVDMQEPPLSAALTPFPETLQNGTSIFDGIGGHSLHYSISGSGAITLTFPYRVVIGSASLTDDQTNKVITATLDSSHTILTFTRTQIDQMNGGLPISPTAQSVFDPIAVTALGFTPIHGVQQNFSATANIKVGL